MFILKSTSCDTTSNIQNLKNPMRKYMWIKEPVRRQNKFFNDYKFLSNLAFYSGICLSIFTLLKIFLGDYGQNLLGSIFTSSALCAFFLFLSSKFIDSIIIRSCLNILIVLGLSITAAIIIKLLNVYVSNLWKIDEKDPKKLEVLLKEENVSKLNVIFRNLQYFSFFAGKCEDVKIKPFSGKFFLQFIYSILYFSFILVLAFAPVFWEKFMNENISEEAIVKRNGFTSKKEDTWTSNFRILIPLFVYGFVILLIFTNLNYFFYNVVQKTVIFPVLLGSAILTTLSIMFISKCKIPAWTKIIINVFLILFISFITSFLGGLISSNLQFIDENNEIFHNTLSWISAAKNYKSYLISVGKCDQNDQKIMKDIIRILSVCLCAVSPVVLNDFMMSKENGVSYKLSLKAQDFLI